MYRHGTYPQVDKLAKSGCALAISDIVHKLSTTPHIVATDTGTH
jgi:hypothetical protein